MKGTLGLKEGSVPFNNDLETTLHRFHTKVLDDIETVHIEDIG